MGKLIVLPGGKITATGPRLVISAEKMADINTRLAKIQELLDELILLNNTIPVDKYRPDE